VYGVQFDLDDMRELRGSVTLAGLNEEQGVMVQALGGMGGPNESNSLWIGLNGSEFVLYCSQQPGSKVSLRIYWTFEFYVERTIVVSAGETTDFGVLVVPVEERRAARPR